MSSFTRQCICNYCNWVLTEDQILLHSCFNTFDDNKQVLIITGDKRVYIQDIQSWDFFKENDEENSSERVENEVAEEMDSNASDSINKQVIDEELINAVQKRPPLYDYRMPLKERSRQKIDLWRKVSEDLNGIYTPTEAEKRWNYLKDRYQKSLNNYKKIQDSTQRSGAAGIPKSQVIKPSFNHHHLMSFLNDIFEHLSSTSSIRMVREPRPSTSTTVENENSLDEVFVNTLTISEENNENELSSVSPNNLSYKSTPTSLERKERKSSGNYDGYDKMLLEMLKKPSELNPIDCFMVRLAEGMRRLPYKVRSKLELEFLTRLNEVEEQLELNN